MGHRKTKLDHIKNTLSSFFKQAVEAPPEPEPEPTPEEPPQPEIPDPLEQDEEFDESETEPGHTLEQNDVLDELQAATQRWKETGDPGLHLEAPVPMRDRAKKVWDVIAHDVSPKVAAALKRNIETVTHTAQAKLQQMQKQRALAPMTTPSPAPTHPPSNPPASNPTTAREPAKTTVTLPPPPTPQQVDAAIIDSWKEVLAKSEEHASPNDREEIEKIYKELSQ